MELDLDLGQGCKARKDSYDLVQGAATRLDGNGDLGRQSTTRISTTHSLQNDYDKLRAVRKVN